MRYWIVKTWRQTNRLMDQSPPLLIDILRDHDLKFGRAVAVMNPDVVPRYDDAGDMVSFLRIRFNRCSKTVHLSHGVQYIYAYINFRRRRET